MPDEDYVVTDAELFIPKCEKRACTIIPLVDDTQLELNEMFTVTLERTAALEGNVNPEPGRTIAEVTIIDTDGNYIGINKYNVPGTLVVWVGGN